MNTRPFLWVSKLWERRLSERFGRRKNRGGLLIVVGDARDSLEENKRTTCFYHPPFHGPVQEVEEGLEHHVVARLVRVVQFGRVQGDGGPRGIPHTLEDARAAG